MDPLGNASRHRDVAGRIVGVIPPIVMAGEGTMP